MAEVAPKPEKKKRDVVFWLFVGALALFGLAEIDGK